MITYKGITDSLPGWAWRTGIKAPTIQDRLQRGWSIEDALSIKAREYCRDKLHGTDKKRCSLCKEIQPRSEEYFRKMQNGSWDSYCHECDKQRRIAGYRKMKRQQVYVVVDSQKIIGVYLDWQSAWNQRLQVPGSKVQKATLSCLIGSNKGLAGSDSKDMSVA